MMANQNYDYRRGSAPCQQARNMGQPYRNMASDSPMARQQAPDMGRPAPSCPLMQMNQQQLLEWIGLTKFACVDASLFLDTHPDDAEAIRYFQEYNRLYLEAMNEYARAYGPLTIAHAQQCGTWWDWVDQPWPWQ